MKNNKLWAVVRGDEIFDTSSVYFQKRSAMEWKKEEDERFKNPKGLIKVVKIEYKIIE